MRFARLSLSARQCLSDRRTTSRDAASGAPCLWCRVWKQRDYIVSGTQTTTDSLYGKPYWVHDAPSTLLHERIRSYLTHDVVGAVDIRINLSTVCCPVKARLARLPRKAGAGVAAAISAMPHTGSASASSKLALLE